MGGRSSFSLTRFTFILVIKIPEDIMPRVLRSIATEFYGEHFKKLEVLHKMITEELRQAIERYNGGYRFSHQYSASLPSTSS